MDDRQRTNSSDEPMDGFERLASRYELYVPWESRLAREIPFLERKLRACGACRVLDCACGPGRHAVALARRGFEVMGLDASPEMLGLARAHARDEGIPIGLVEGRFESLSQAFERPFDALICLGNSLSAAENLEVLETVVEQFALVLRPGGVAITQTVDFSVVAPDPVTPSPVREAREGATEYLFVKSFVRIRGQMAIHWVSLERKDGRWRSEVTLREVTAVDPRHLQELLSRAGFSSVEAYGDYGGAAFDLGRSRDLIALARRGPA